jgi:hypothetical protein
MESPITVKDEVMMSGGYLQASSVDAARSAKFFC